MSKRLLWLVTIVGLLIVLTGAVAMANEAAAVLRNRLSCDEPPGEAITRSGLVVAHDWNALQLEATDGAWTVLTGPFKVSRNIADLTGQAVTVIGYTGPGRGSQSDPSESNIIRATTIVSGEDTIDLTVSASEGFGPHGGRNAAAFRAQRGGMGKMLHRAPASGSAG